MKKIILCITLIATLVLGLFPVTYASAAADPVISAVCPSTAAPGDSVTVKIMLENNPGLSALNIGIEYDPAILKLDSPQNVTQSTALSSLIFINVNDDTYEINPLRVMWAGSASDNSNGELMSIRFTVLATAKTGPCPITVSYLPSGTIDASGNMVDVIPKDGSIEISNDGGSGGNNEDPPSQNQNEEDPGTTPPDTTPPDTTPPVNNIPDGIWHNPFVDVSINNWFYTPVRFVTEKGLMNGIGQTVFAPGDLMTRGMLVTVLYRLEGNPAVDGTVTFRDFESGKWYSEAIIWAIGNSIATGYSERTFGINDPITREQAVTIICRYAKYKNVPVNETAALSTFTDYSDIADWAIDNIRWAVAVELLQGRTPTTLVPKGNLNRAEMATILQRYIEGFQEN